MEEKKTRFVVYSDDYYGNSGREILGHVNTLTEAQEMLARRCRQLFKPDDCEKMIAEIFSHTEDELVGRDELTLYGSNCYYSEGIARVEGYVDEESKIAHEVTLGEILKCELAEVGTKKWELKISDEKEKSYLRIEGQDKIPVSIKYEHIAGMPTHHLNDFMVYKNMGSLTISETTFPGIEWNKVSNEEADRILKEYFQTQHMFYSEQDAINSLPLELVLDKSYRGPYSIEPYDRYGYHIEGISAYHDPYSNSSGVLIHIKKS